MTEQTATVSPRSATGFCLIYTSDALSNSRMEYALAQCLQHFPWLARITLDCGASRLYLWGHDDPHLAYHTAPDGTRSILIGSPLTSITWNKAFEMLTGIHGQPSLPWDGRCILLRIAPDGETWTIWNDWAGAYPVWYAPGIAASLEPLVVQACGFTPNDFNPRGLVELLVHGHFLGDDTLYTRMAVIPQDSCTTWRQGVYSSSIPLHSVEEVPSPERGWDELLEEMHAHTMRAVGGALREAGKILLPLSSGMDSRLIACLAAELGIETRAYSYTTYYEADYAGYIARVLRIPWRRIPLGQGYLTANTGRWLDWFGSALHTHGMYQLPMLDTISGETGVIPDGFYGNNMAGGNHPSEGLLTRGVSYSESFQRGYPVYWSPADLSRVLTIDVSATFAEIEDLLATQVDSVRERSFYQQRNVLDMWNRQRRFVFYQPMMYDYFKRGICPFMDRAYARFCLSLPRTVLEKRRLQRDMLARYWPWAATICCSFDQVPMVPSRRGMLFEIVQGFLRQTGIKRFPPYPDHPCVVRDGWQAFPAMRQMFTRDGLFRVQPLTDALQGALQGSSNDYYKLAALQAVAHRMI